MKFNILRIVKSISPTSSALYAHSLQRLNYSNDKITIIDTKKSDIKNIELPANLHIKQCNSSIYLFLLHTKNWLFEARKMNAVNVIHISSPLPGLLFCLTTIFRRNMPRIVFSIHNSFMNYRLLTLAAIFILCLYSKKLIFVSQNAKCSFQEKTIFRFLRSVKDSVVIDNGVDLELINPKREYHIRSNLKPLRLIIVGRFVPQKNYPFLFKVLNELNIDYECDIYGDGPEYEITKNLFDGLVASGRVRFYGVVQRKDIFHAFKRADVLLLMSKWEGLPVVLLEAMACGLIVIASKIPVHMDISNNSSGVICCNFDHNVIVDELLKISLLDQPDLNALRKDNIDAVCHFFSLESMVNSYSRQYEGVR